MRRLLAALACVGLLAPALAWGQPELRSGAKGSKPAANPTTTVIDSTTNALDVNVTQGGSPTPSTAACKTVTVNAQGSSNADVTVAGTAVSVMAASTTRCSATIKNSSANEMRCAPTGVTPTPTVGFAVAGGETLNLGLESQQAWSCIRTGASSATASVGEATP